jgi:hypothetical protein
LLNREDSNDKNGKRYDTLHGRHPDNLALFSRLRTTTLLCATGLIVAAGGLTNRNLRILRHS